MCCSAAAIGLDLILDTLRRARPRFDCRIVLGLILAGLLVRAVRLYPLQDLSTDESAKNYGERAARILPRHSIIVTYTTPPEWKYHTVFRWYVKLLQHERPDVSVVSFPPTEFVRQLVRANHPMFTYVRTQPLSEFAHEPVQGIDEGLLRLRLD